MSIFKITGQIVECGRNDDDANEIVMIVENDTIAIVGCSDELTARAALCLYTDVTIEMTSVKP